MDGTGTRKNSLSLSPTPHTMSRRNSEPAEQGHQVQESHSTRPPGRRVTQYKPARWKSKTVQVRHRHVEESNSTSSPGRKSQTVKVCQVEVSHSTSSPGRRVRQYKFARWKSQTVQVRQVEVSHSTSLPGRRVRQYKDQFT